MAATATAPPPTSEESHGNRNSEIAIRIGESGIVVFVNREELRKVFLTMETVKDDETRIGLIQTAFLNYATTKTTSEDSILGSDEIRRPNDFIVSCKSARITQDMIPMITSMVKKYVKGEISSNREMIIGRIASILTCRRDLIFGPATARLAFNECLSLSERKSSKAVVSAILDHPDEVEWNTPDGRSTDTWEACYDWINTVPSYRDRIKRTCSKIAEIMSTKESPLQFPTRAALPIYAKSSNTKSKWTKYVKMFDGRTKAGRTSPSPPEIESSAIPLFVRRNANLWKYLNEEVGSISSLDSKHCVYILAIVDPNANVAFANQMYVGSSTDVDRRWFRDEKESHLNSICRVLTDARAEEKSAYLVDATLAQLWAEHGTWEGYAMLFLVKSGLDSTEAAFKTETDIMERFKLRHSCNGMNCKKSKTQ